MIDNLLPRGHVQLPGDPLHLRMPPCPTGKMFKLARSVAPVEPGEPGGKVAIAFAARAMAGGTGRARADGAAAEGDQFAAGLEGIGGNGRRRARRQCQDRDKERGPFHVTSQSSTQRSGSPRLMLAIAMAMAAALTTACKPPPPSRHDPDAAAVARGRELVRQTGCGACHAFPDIAWPQGRAGPSLVTFDEHGPIAGVLPNTPANLAAFVRDAPVAKPGSPMPAMPLSPREASDVAAYLHGLADD
ncbi:MAG: c-type cytochrome [Novosphingobium sp.]|nr:c-type cytochrome [Novosphingobium sp.]